MGPFEVTAGKGAHEAERPTKVKGLYLCGPIQFMDSFSCFSSVWSFCTYIWPFSTTWGTFTSV